MIELPLNTNFIPTQVQAVVLDWAGTTVDFGSRAPVMAMLNAFEQAGVAITEQEAREPMGRAKRDHLQALLDNPAIAERWQQAHGRPSTEQDLDTIYAQFLDVQAESVAEFSALIPGCNEAIEACRSMGLKIGSSTGYTRALLDRVAERAKSEGFVPDAMLSADDISPGRPAPWLCMENARRLGVYPMSAIIKVDDTPAGIAAGRNAGCWSVGVVQSGNEVGLSQAEFEALTPEQRAAAIATASERLTQAGAHFLIDTIAELPTVVARVNALLADGKLP